MPLDMAAVHSRAEPPAPGLLQSLKAYLRTWLEILKTRLELFSTELQEETDRIKEITLLTVVAAFCFGLAVLLVTVFVIACFWDGPYRLVVLGGFALFYLVLGGVALLIVRQKGRIRPRLFSATLAELSKDYQRLS